MVEKKKKISVKKATSENKTKRKKKSSSTSTNQKKKSVTTKKKKTVTSKKKKNSKTLTKKERLGIRCTFEWDRIKERFEEEEHNFPTKEKFYQHIDGLYLSSKQGINQKNLLGAFNEYKKNQRK